jgi:hypothetical protein
VPAPDPLKLALMRRLMLLPYDFMHAQATTRNMSAPDLPASAWNQLLLHRFRGPRLSGSRSPGCLDVLGSSPRLARWLAVPPAGQPSALSSPAPQPTFPGARRGAPRRGAEGLRPDSTCGVHQPCLASAVEGARLARLLGRPLAWSTCSRPESGTRCLSVDT